MATIARPRGQRSSLRRLVPVLYLALAMVVAVVVLPTALRPPPDPSTESGALSPDAPPDDNPDQLIQSVQQAAGGGAGAKAGGSTTSTTAAGEPPPPESTTTTVAKKAGSGFCFGTPKRQVESVYSGPCAPGFIGDNGGATSHNVFPTELRLGFAQALGAPSEGPVPETPPGGNESSENRTMRVLQAYVNQRFETYGRHIRFYGLKNSDDGAEQVQIAVQADEDFKLFASSYLNRGFCQETVRRKLVAFCDPMAEPVYAQSRPGLYSVSMNLTQMQGFGAEYACKKLVGKPPIFGGNVTGTDRRFGYFSLNSAAGGVAPSVFVEAFRRECGGEVAVPVEASKGASTNEATAAMTRMRSAGVTTVVINAEVGNVLLAMTAAESIGYRPEWVVLGNYSIDNNTIATLLPKTQTAHLFGISGNEMSQRNGDRECVRAYRSIDPDNDPNGSTCTVFWRELILMMSAIQGAGPRLTPASFEKALVGLGYRYDQTAWNSGGGFGRDDWSYVDAVGEIWFDSGAADASNGAPGAYRWTHDAKRYRRGQLDADVSQLFTSGISEPPPGT